ncbi:MAG: sugar ABC transporter permease [Caldilineaceae bacterium]
MQFTVFARGEKRKRSLLWAERRDAFLFILPWFIGFIVFTAGPMLASLYMSFTRWEIVTAPVWVGLGQYEALPGRPLLSRALEHGLLCLLGRAAASFLALLAALAMNLNLRGIRIFRTLYYVPSLTPAVANAILWMDLRSAVGTGQRLSQANRPAAALLAARSQTGKPAFIIMSLWTIGAQMVILLAGLKGIPQHLYEAAEIDGANAWHRFRRHAAHADAGALLQPDHRHHRRVSGLHPGLHHDPGRAQLRHPLLPALSLSHGV